jgi:hypothetical protein
MSTEAFAREQIAYSQPLQRNGKYAPHTTDQKAVIAEGAALPSVAPDSL